MPYTVTIKVPDDVVDVIKDTCKYYFNRDLNEEEVQKFLNNDVGSLYEEKFRNHLDGALSVFLGE